MGVLNNKRIRKFYRSIGYTIRPPSKLYEDNQEIIKIDLEDRITKQSRPFNISSLLYMSINLVIVLDGGHKIKHATF